MTSTNGVEILCLIKKNKISMLTNAIFSISVMALHGRNYLAQKQTSPNQLLILKTQTPKIDL